MSASSQSARGWPDWFTALLGLWLGVGLLKFGNPVILDRLVEAPKEAAEFIFQPWPVLWGYFGMAGLILLAFTLPRRAPPRHWLLILPLVWLVWQWIASARSVNPELTRVTLPHFTVCVVCFYLGLVVLGRAKSSSWFWVGFSSGFALVLWFGLDQHYGGLEATRRAFYENTPGWQTYSPDFLKKIQSNRIFSTLVYPNALAGAVLFFLPPCSVWLWRRSEHWPRILRGVTLGCLIYAGLGCLFWTESRSGWLIALVLIVAALLNRPVPLKSKLLIVAAVFGVGLIAFAARNQAYFKRGATSVSARGDYWRAAFTTFKERPVFGAGPGTFAKTYQRIKPPEAEMAKLAHNDYLEQACDSGVIGFVTYALFWLGSLALLLGKVRADSFRFAIWLGLLGWALQSGVEFGLYIPALAWPVFLLTGWLWSDFAPRNGVDSPAS